MKQVFFIVFSFGLVVSGCKTINTATSLNSKDSTRVDTFTKIEYLYSIPSDVLDQLYSCDSLGNIKEKCIANSQFIIDSLLKIKPIIKETQKIHVAVVNRDVYQPTQVKVLPAQKVYINTVTIISLIFNAIQFFCLIIISYMFYKFANK